MVKLKFKFFLLAIVCILLAPGSCKKCEYFTITGIWEVNHYSYSTENADIVTILYEFFGNESEGGLKRVVPTGGVSGGSYEVQGDRIDFYHSHGRGLFFFRFVYTGCVYPELEKMEGNFEYIQSEPGKNTVVWSGAFTAWKYHNDL